MVTLLRIKFTIVNLKMNINYKDVPIEENYIENCKTYTEKILDVSNDIIVYNYFRKELSEVRFEKE